MNSPEWPQLNHKANLRLKKKTTFSIETVDAVYECIQVNQKNDSKFSSVKGRI